MGPPQAAVYARTLARAALLSGGPIALANKLGVRAAQMEAWLSGAEEIPQATFLELVDVVMDAALGSLQEPSSSSPASVNPLQP